MLEPIALSIYGSAMLLLMAAAAPSPYPPLDAATGMDSNVDRASVHLATTPEQWYGFWQEHKGITPIGNTQNLNFPSVEKPPAVDFDHNEVLVIFGGLAQQGGYKVVDSERVKRTIVVRLRPLPLLGSGTAAAGSFKANPFAFIVFKKTQLPFDVQMQLPDSSGTVQWQTVAKVGGQG